MKGTKLYSIFTGKCPVCHNDTMYIERNPYKVSKALKMRERCRSCNTKYKIEPSFFYGAMYVSYPVGLFFAGTAFVFSHLIVNLNLIITYLIIVVVMIFSLPIILRISRNIWINMFKKYKKPEIKK